jgi:hypothetical protein
MPDRVRGEELVALLGVKIFAIEKNASHTARIVLKAPSVGKLDANMQRSTPKMSIASMT